MVLHIKWSYPFPPPYLYEPFPINVCPDSNLGRALADTPKDF